MLPRKCNGELKNFSASLDDLMPYYKPNLPVANSTSFNEILTHLNGAKIQGMLLKSATKIDCKSIISTLIKNPITHENMFKIRSKSTDLIIKKEIALTLLEDLLTLYIHVRTFTFEKSQIQSHKIKQSRLKSRSLRTSLKKMDFENWQLFLTIKTAIFIAANI